MAKEPLVVYWSPFESDWNMLYPEPITLMSDFMKRKNPDRGYNNFFSCPASSDYFKNTYMFSNGLTSYYDYDFTTTPEPTVTPISPNHITFSVSRPPTVIGQPMLFIQLKYIFFCEESVKAHFAPPFYHKPGYMQYGACAPGIMDIGQWFRPYTTELMMWDMKGTLKLEEGEPLFYVTVPTDRPVIFKRFYMNDTLKTIADHCIAAPYWQGTKLPLVKRYKAFVNSKTNKIVAKEIKKNLL